jgi:hypothetical protein
MSILYCFHKNSVTAQAILTNDFFFPVKKGSKIKILHHRENGGKLTEYFISFSSLLLMMKNKETNVIGKTNPKGSFKYLK